VGDPFVDDLRSALDPAWWAEAVVGLALDDWQRRVISSRHNWIALLCARQCGKTTVASLKAAHLALFGPRSKVLIVTASMKQALNVFSAVEEAVRKTDEGKRRDEDNKTGLRLSNGSSVVCVPSSADTIRGFSAIDLLIEDEASFVDGLRRLAGPRRDPGRPHLRVRVMRPDELALGVDIGQTSDPSAIAVLRRVPRWTGLDRGPRRGRPSGLARHVPVLGLGRGRLRRVDGGQARDAPHDGHGAHGGRREQPRRPHAALRADPVVVRVRLAPLLGGDQACVPAKRPLPLLPRWIGMIPPSHRHRKGSLLGERAHARDGPPGNGRATAPWPTTRPRLLRGLVASPRGRV
jgi:hypothetical protein